MKNPITNALLAGGYIVVLVTTMHYLLPGPDTPDNYLAPVIFLSLFTLSAGVMGYLFLAEPVRKYIDGEKREATSFFLKTLGSFAVITAVILIINLFIEKQ